jgi:hypothetical protein
MIVQSFFKSMDNFALVVVLFFILCGNIMTAGTIVKLLKVVNILVSWAPAWAWPDAWLAAFRRHIRLHRGHGGGHRQLHDPGADEKGYPEKYTIGLMTTSPNLGSSSALHQHDPLLHDHQRLPAGAVLDRFYSGHVHHGSYVHLYLFYFQGRHRH